jgi:hypothetical protein
MKSRFAWAEITPARIAQAVARRVQDLPHALSWSLPLGQSAANRELLRQWSGRHAGARCFVLGNGPSLARMDLLPLAGEITFGLNRIYLLFESLGFTPTYYACINELVLSQFGHEIRDLDMPKFLDWNSRSLFPRADPLINFVRISSSVLDGFGSDLRKPVYSGGTVTYVALQIAFVMGFSEVVLIGVDHSFSSKGAPNAVVVREAGPDPNHFHPAYFPKGSKWQLPDLRRSEMAYALARRQFELAGRRILDATVGGHCPVFERVEFASLF